MMGSKLIALIVIVLGVVAIAQLVRLYELSSKLRKEGEHETNSRDNRLNARLFLVFMGFLYIGFVYLMYKFGWTGRGEAASVHGKETDWLLNINFILIIAVFFLTNTLLFSFAHKYIRKPGVKAYYFPHDNKLEMIWTVIPAATLAIIIILGLRSWNSITDVAAKESIVVELFSKQFDWTARYSGVDNKLGKFDYKLTSDDNELALLTTNTLDSAIYRMENGVSGIIALENRLNDYKVVISNEEREKLSTDLERKSRLVRLLQQMRGHHDSKIDASAWDDIIQKDTLYLCENKEYEFNFRSKDVIHSAFFPHFRAQMNTVPGLTTRFKFTPDITTKEMRVKMNDPNFHFVLMCNKICGSAHYKMKMMVVVLDEKSYGDWVKSKEKSTFKDSYFPAVAAPVTTDVVAAPVTEVVAEN